MPRPCQVPCTVGRGIMEKSKFVVCFTVFLLLYVGKSSGGTVNSEGVVEEVSTERLSVGDQVSRKMLILAEGDSVNLECEFSSKPWSFIQWLKIYFTDDYKHDVVIANNTYTNGSRTISTVYLRDVSGRDAGNYSCISANTQGTTALEFFVSVKEKTFCNERICGENGTCNELLNGYICKCNPGYMGDHCELADVCFYNPCLNNGSCEITGEGFNCNCTLGYKGELCDKRSCLPSSCHGGGLCSETSDGDTKCLCKPSYTGKHCQHHCTFRSGSVRYCRSGITCIMSHTGTENCHCHNYNRERYCIHQADVVNECSDPNICNHRGRCVDQIYKYTCNCNSHATGLNCEFYDECSADVAPCWKYGGTCVDLPVGYRCQCPKGQHGNHCQYIEEPCKVACQDEQMVVTCDMTFLHPKLRRLSLKSNPGAHQCKFSNRIASNYRYFVANGRGRNIYSYTFTGNIPYTSCETDVEYKDDYIIYRNSLRGGVFNASQKPSDTITRATGYFLFQMECKQPLKLNESSIGIGSISLRRNETVELAGEDSIRLQTIVSYHNKLWQPVSKYEVGERLFVKLRLSRRTRNQILSNIVFNPLNCYATPNDTSPEPRYDLLQNGCVKDETFRYEECRKDYGYRDVPHACFSFESFSFIGYDDDKLYIHCEAKICVKKGKDPQQCEDFCRDQSVPESTTSATSTTTALSRQKRDTSFLASLSSFFSSGFKSRSSLDSGIGRIPNRVVKFANNA